MQCVIKENTLIKLTHHDETKIRAHDCFILQEDLTSLGQWEADWHMTFNVAKCHSMRVTGHQHH